MELDIQRSAPAIDSFDPDLLGVALEQGKPQQGLDRIRQRTETIPQIGAHRLRLLGVLHVGDALVGTQALLLVGDVVGRDANVQAQIQG